MFTQHFFRLAFCSAILVFGCNKDDHEAAKSVQNKQEFLASKAGSATQKPEKSNGATQITGIGYYATTDECNAANQGADYAVRMTGDLVGCLYTYIEDFECSPSGTYREEGREYFVGTYRGKYGTFRTTYKFESKYEGCAANGAALGAEIFGRCQHPIVSGSGDGVFKGVTGRLDMKDDVVAIKFYMRGHLKF